MTDWHLITLTFLAQLYVWFWNFGLKVLLFCFRHICKCSHRRHLFQAHEVRWRYQMACCAPTWRHLFQWILNYVVNNYYPTKYNGHIMANSVWTIPFMKQGYNGQLWTWKMQLLLPGAQLMCSFWQMCSFSATEHGHASLWLVYILLTCG